MDWLVVNTNTQSIVGIPGRVKKNNPSSFREPLDKRQGTGTYYPFSLTPI